MPEFSIDRDKVNIVDAKHGDEKRELIIRINQWVEEAQAGSTPAMEALLLQFNSLIISTAQKYYEHNKSIVTWDELLEFDTSSFVELTLHDYVIGGPAHYNVFVKRMLNLRTLWYIERTIREQRRSAPLIDYTNEIYLPDETSLSPEDVMHNVCVTEAVHACLSIIKEKFSERDYSMFMDYFFGIENNYCLLAHKYHLSEPRISGIINSIKTEMKKTLVLYDIEV